MKFNELYKKHKNLVFNLALNYVQNIEDAEEITQDVFLKVHQSIYFFKGESSLKTWIYRITINKSLDFIKSKSQTNKKQWFNLNSEALGDFEPKDFNHPGITLENKENLENLFRLINKLPEQQKTALILVKIDHLTIEETAIIMKTSYKSVESLLQRAKNNLKNNIKNEGI